MEVSGGPAAELHLTAGLERDRAVLVRQSDQMFAFHCPLDARGGAYLRQKRSDAGPTFRAIRNGHAAGEHRQGFKLESNAVL